MRSLVTQGVVACLAALVCLGLAGSTEPASLGASGMAGVLATIVWWRLRRTLPPMRWRLRWARWLPRMVWSAWRDGAQVLWLAVRPGPFRRGAWIDVAIPSGEGPEHAARRAAIELALSFGPGSAVASAEARTAKAHVIDAHRSAARFEDLL